MTDSKAIAPTVRAEVADVAAAPDRLVACDECMARSWLLGRLSGHIERHSANRAGRKVGEILSLENGALLDLVANSASGREVRREFAGLDQELVRLQAMEADCEVVCRHRHGYPESLRELGDQPAALFVRGRSSILPRLGTSGAVTIVGARRATAYGLSVARSLGSELGLAGLVVVSGLAMGIDAAAHEGALDTGSSCAVLGSGPDRAYPRRHRRLYESHVESGLVVSELPPGTSVWRWTFPARNRLMAALSGMTVVVEAAARSGSLITVTMADALGREVGAVPGPVTSQVSDGPNELLAGGAHLIRGASDILEAMLGIGYPVGPARGPRLDADLELALDHFERCGGDLESLALGLSGHGIAADIALARLELLGYIDCSAPGKWTRSTLARPA